MRMGPKQIGLFDVYRLDGDVYLRFGELNNVREEG